MLYHVAWSKLCKILTLSAVSRVFKAVFLAKTESSSDHYVTVHGKLVLTNIIACLIDVSFLGHCSCADSQLSDML
jgi:hypothetical protein